MDCKGYTKVQNLLKVFEEERQLQQTRRTKTAETQKRGEETLCCESWEESWIRSHDDVIFNDGMDQSILEYARHVSQSILEASHMRIQQGGVHSLQEQQQAKLYAEEFPSLPGSSSGNLREDSSGTSKTGQIGKSKQVTVKRRIVPTAVDSVHIDETFVSPHVEKTLGNSSSPFPNASASISMFASRFTGDNPCAVKDDGKLMDRNTNNMINGALEQEEELYMISTPGGRLKPSAPHYNGAFIDSFELRQSLVGDGHDVEHGTPLGARIQGLALLHARVLARSSTIFLLSELSFLFELLVVDPHVTIDVEEGDEAGMKSGMDAVVYAGTVLQHSGEVLHGLGRDILEDLEKYVRNIKTCDASMRKLERMISSALTEQEPRSLLYSPSVGRIQSSGPLLGLTGLNVFLNDSSGVISRSSDDQKKISNRESFRDSWFKLMREAVHRSSSLDAWEHHKGSTKVGNNAVSEERHGDMVVLKLIQEESGQLLRGLRIDNYDPFAELFTAAVLQAAITGETVMDEELTGIAKQNVSRFESLNKRFQVTSNRKSAVASRRGQQKSLLMSRKGHVDHSAEHALRISGEFSKPLRPFILFLEATDSHRLNNSLTRIMRAKLISLLLSSSESTSLNDTGLLSLEELCISTTSLASFLGYLSFTKGQGSLPAPSLEKIQEQGDFDGSHSIDVLNALRQCIPSDIDTLSPPGNLYRYIPWICRYVKFLVWNRDLCGTTYFKKLFALLQEIRQHPFLRPESQEFCGIAPLCLRGILDNLSWYFDLEMEKLDGYTEFKNVDALNSTIRDDIQWANTVLGRRYLEITCPDIFHLQASLSPATSRGQEVKTRKKIRPTAPVKTGEAVSPPLLPDTQSKDRADDNQEKVVEELERVFLDQYSNGSLVTDIKLRDFVTWCSDAIARQGVSTGLGQVSEESVPQDISQDMEDCLRQYRQEGKLQGQRTDKQKIRMMIRGLEDHFVARYCRVLQVSSIAALQNKVKHCSKESTEILLPSSWGSHVKMTAAAIIARKAESAGMRQLISELKKLASSRIKKEIDSILAHYF